MELGYAAKGLQAMRLLSRFSILAVSFFLAFVQGARQEFGDLHIQVLQFFQTPRLRRVSQSPPGALSGTMR